MRPKIRSLVLTLILVTVCLAPAGVSTLAGESPSFSRGVLEFVLEGIPALLPAGAAPAAGPHIIPIGTAMR